MHCQNLIFYRINESKSPTYILAFICQSLLKYIKTVFVKSSFYENKVVSRKISQLTIGEVHCFYTVKIMQNNVLKMNGLLES